MQNIYMKKAFFGFEMCLHDLSNNDIDLIIDSFHKVWANLDLLREN